MQIASTWYQSIIRHIKTKFFRRQSGLLRRADEAEADAGVPAVGVAVVPVRDGTV